MSKKKGSGFIQYEETDDQYKQEEFLIDKAQSTPILKRLFDITLSLLAILFFLPIAALLAFAIILEDRGPILYAQKRIGKGGTFFYLYKFRSMIVNADKHGDLGGVRGRDWRVTRIGQAMRDTAMDELPQLFNILVGQMSFVGPRPERPIHHRRLSAKISDFPLRAQVVPGLAGLAALCNTKERDTFIKEMRCEILYDLFYVRRQSVCFDAALVFAGVKTTLLKDWGTEKRKF